MSLKLWLIRHGETLGNEKKWIQGHIDEPLSEIGRQQARLLAKRLATIPFHGVYSSPLSRAYETAQIIFGERQVTIDTMDDLIEIDMGNWESQSFFEMFTVESFGKRRIFGQDRDLVGGAETISALLQRGLRVVKRILTQHQEGNIALVSHSAFLTALVTAQLRLNDRYELAPLLIGNASLSILEYRHGRWLLSLLNDQSHFRVADDLSSPADDQLLLFFGLPENGV